MCKKIFAFAVFLLKLNLLYENYINKVRNEYKAFC